MGMDIKEIMSIIPHRQPFLLIDRVEEIVEGEKVIATKNVSYNEPFFAGHFPQEPVMPGGRCFAGAGCVAGHRTGDAGCVDRGSNGAGRSGSYFVYG